MQRVKDVSADILELVQYEKFLEFWKYFGKALHVLRFNRVVMKLWQIGLVYGFMSRTDINNALLAHEPGTFIIRFSERFAPTQPALICRLVTRASL